MALALCQELPVRQAAALLRCSDKRLWRRIEHYVSAARALDDMSDVGIVGIDETSLRKGQNYITVVHDLGPKRRLLFACEGRDHQTVLNFADDLKAHGGDPERIEHVCQDMSAAFAKGVGEALPNAQISYDRFHVIAMANEAMDGVRRAEMGDQPQAVTAALGGNDKAKARKDLRAWLSWARRSRLEPFKKLAKTLSQTFDGVVRGMLDNRSNATGRRNRPSAPPEVSEPPPTSSPSRICACPSSSICRPIRCCQPCRGLAC